MTFLNVFAADSGENDTGFSNADYDRLIAEAQSTGDQTVRMRDMHQAEGILMAQMPVIPVSFYTDPLLVGKNITGYVDSPMGYLYLMWASVK
jgi:oligopeptide transport system substrate-binding protein